MSKQSNQRYRKDVEKTTVGNSSYEDNSYDDDFEDDFDDDFDDDFEDGYDDDYND